MPSHLPLVSTPGQDLFYLLALLFFFKRHFCLLWLYREFHCDISLYLSVLYPKLIQSLHYSPFYFSPFMVIRKTFCVKLLHAPSTRTTRFQNSASMKGPQTCMSLQRTQFFCPCSSSFLRTWGSFREIWWLSRPQFGLKTSTSKEMHEYQAHPMMGGPLVFISVHSFFASISNECARNEANKRERKGQTIYCLYPHFLGEFLLRFMTASSMWDKTAETSAT
jgi:hypothetical protein